MAQMITQKKLSRSALSSPTLFTIGLLLVLFWILVAIFAEKLAPYSPDWLGSDMFSQLVLAARNMVVMTMIAGIVAFAIGLIYGTVAGYYQDRLEPVSGLLLALPIISLLILTRYHVDPHLNLGNEFYMIIAAILVVGTCIFRRVRALVTDIKQRDFVLVAIMRGEKSFYIIGCEILPNIIKPLFADFLMRCSQIVVIIALIGFLGLEVSLGASSFANWGAMVRAGQEYIDIMGYYLFIPCIAIISLVLGLNLMAVSIQCDNIGNE